MSFYGKRWMIDGLPVGLIMRSAPSNGRYTVVFEREFASLEQIEAVNWAQPTVEYIGPHGNEAGLPEGYGFTVEDIQYESGTKAYRVVLKTASQYLGDVTGYQDQVAELELTVTDQAAVIQSQTVTIERQESTIQEQTGTISEQECTILEQAATIAELENSGGGAVITSQLEAAYMEGVESNG